MSNNTKAFLEVLIDTITFAIIAIGFILLITAI